MDIQPPTNDDLKTKILNRIESGAICPKSRLSFQGWECVLWCLWLFTIVIGALAVAISFFVMLQHTYSIYEVTYSSSLVFFIETLPFLWFSVFLVMVIFAVYNLSHTKNGYRYPLWQIFGSSMILSLAGGSLLHLAGTGFILDKQMGLFTEYYESQEKRAQKIWQQPEQGRLLGRLHATGTEDGRLTATFVDHDSVVWFTNISELDSEEILLLGSGLKVRLFGEVINTDSSNFHACAALPWLHETVATRSDLNNIRQLIISKSNHYLSLPDGKTIIDSPCTRKFSQLRFEFGR